MTPPWAQHQRVSFALLVVALTTKVAGGGDGNGACAAGATQTTCDDGGHANRGYSGAGTSGPRLCLTVRLAQSVPALAAPFTGRRKAKACFAVPSTSPAPPDEVPPAGELAAAAARALGLTADHLVRGVREPVGGPLLPLRFAAVAALAAAAGTGSKRPPVDMRLIVVAFAGRDEPPRTVTKLFASTPVVDLVQYPSGRARRRIGRELLRALKGVGFARIRVGRSASTRLTEATEAGHEMLELLGSAPPDVQQAAFLRCHFTNKMTGFEHGQPGISYLHVRRAHARGAEYIDADGRGPHVDAGSPQQPIALPYSAVPGAPAGLQRKLDRLYDAMNAAAAEALSLVAAGLGMAPNEAKAFAAQLVTPDANFDWQNPLSDSYYRLFRYDTHAKRDGCFGLAHADVGTVTIAPVGTAPGLQMLLPFEVTGPGSGFDPAVQQWRWAAVEAEAIRRNANAPGHDEWIVFAGEALARATGVHPVVHRVCLGDDPESAAPVAVTRGARISAPFFQRPGAQALIPKPPTKKGSESDNLVPMASFFQLLKRRIYNELDLNAIAP